MEDESSPLNAADARLRVAIKDAQAERPSKAVQVLTRLRWQAAIKDAQAERPRIETDREILERVASGRRS